MDLYVIRQIDQLCNSEGDYETQLRLQQLNHECHAVLPELMIDSIPLSQVLAQSPKNCQGGSDSWVGTFVEVCH